MKNKCRGREREHAPHITHEASAVSTGSAGEVVVGVGAAGRGVGFSGAPLSPPPRSASPWRTSPPPPPRPARTCTWRRGSSTPCSARRSTPCSRPWRRCTACSSPSSPSWRAAPPPPPPRRARPPPRRPPPPRRRRLRRTRSPRSARCSRIGCPRGSRAKTRVSRRPRRPQSLFCEQTPVNGHIPGKGRRSSRRSPKCGLAPSLIAPRHGPKQAQRTTAPTREFVSPVHELPYEPSMGRSAGRHI